MCTYGCVHVHCIHVCTQGTCTYTCTSSHTNVNSRFSTLSSVLYSTSSWIAAVLGRANVQTPPCPIDKKCHSLWHQNELQIICTTELCITTNMEEARSVETALHLNCASSLIVKTWLEEQTGPPLFVHQFNVISSMGPCPGCQRGVREDGKEKNRKRESKKKKKKQEEDLACRPRQTLAP